MRAVKRPLPRWAALLLGGYALLGLFWAFSSDARVTLQFSPEWVLLINPPSSTDCHLLGFRVIGPDGEYFNATLGVAVPHLQGVEVTPLTTATAERIYCDGFE